MLNKYSLWKNLLILLLVVLSGIYAAPNFYPPDPAIQISHDSGTVDQAALDQATAALDAEGIAYTGVEIEEGVALIRLEHQDDQSRAQQQISFTLSQEYIVALNLAANTPAWLAALRPGPMTYGLDLQGGVHFLMEVDLEGAVEKQLSDTVSAMRTLLREERVRYRPPLGLDGDRIAIRFADADTRSAANSLIRAEFPDLVFRTAQEGGDYALYYTISDANRLLLQQ